MTTERDGGPAFPRGGFAAPENQYIDQGETGMSLRDWFAGQALALAGINAAMGAAAGIEVGSAGDIARLAYELADSMIAARTRPNGTEE